MSLSVVQQDGPWRKAFESLDVKIRATLQESQLNKRDVLSAVCKAAEISRQKCLEKRFKFTIRGKEIILRDVLEKILGWVDKFTQIGDFLAGLDPHASIPWAAVKFVLAGVGKDVKKFGSAVADIEILSGLITRYAHVEKIYLRRKSEVTKQIELRLVRLYTEILKSLSEHVEYFKMHTAERMFKSLFDGADMSHKASIDEEEDLIREYARTSDAEEQQNMQIGVINIQNLMADLSKRVMDTAVRVEKDVAAEKYRKVLQWLSDVRVEEHHKLYSGQRLEGTYEWLFTHPKYISWQESSSSEILALHGILGSGKTILCSAVIDSLPQRSGGPASLYFYCADAHSEPSRSNTVDILRCLLRQAAVIDGPQRKLHESIVIEYDRRMESARVQGFEEPSQLSREDCSRLFLEVADINPITVVVDAIDEVNKKSRFELLDTLKSLVRDSGNVVKVFLTYRNDPDIGMSLDQATYIPINKDTNAQSVRLFLEHEVSTKMQHVALSTTQKSEMVQVLAENAGEMFLWASLQVSRISEAMHPDDAMSMMRSISQLPLDEIYLRCFEDMRRSGDLAFQIALRTISWLLCKKEPLTPSVLAKVTTPKTSETQLTIAQITSICKNLIFEDRESNTVRFNHLSVRHFFAQRPELAPALVEDRVTSACIDICMDSLGNEVQADINLAADAYQYAAMYWPTHYQGSQSSDGNTDCTKKALNFIFDSEVGEQTNMFFEMWLDDVKLMTEGLSSYHRLMKTMTTIRNATLSPLHLACVFGMKEVLDRLSTAQGIDWDQRSDGYHENDLGYTALYLAASAGNDSATRFLLSQGADPHIICGKHDEALYAACFEGHAKVVEILLAVNNDEDDRRRIKSAFDKACRALNEKIAIQILESTPKITDQSIYDAFVLKATAAGLSDVVKALSRIYPTLWANGQHGQANLERAVLSGKVEMVKRVLQRNKSVKGKEPHYLLSLAALHGYVSIVEHFLDEGFDIETPAIYGHPLRAASLTGQLPVVSLLIRRGANVNTLVPHGSALEAASIKGYLAIAKLLIMSGADVNQKGGEYGRPIQAAAFHGHLDVVKDLLEKGASPLDDGLYDTALHAAAHGGHNEVLAFFLENGFITENPLVMVMAMAATMSDNSSGFPYRMLLEKHSEDSRATTINDKLDSTSVLSISESDHGLNTVTAPVKRRYISRKSTLYLAASTRSLDTLRLILENDPGIDVDILRGAIEQAAFKGWSDGVSLLLEHSDFDNELYRQISEAIIESAKDVPSSEYLRILELACRYCTPESRPDILRLSLQTYRMGNPIEIYRMALLETPGLEKELLELAFHRAYELDSSDFLRDILNVTDSEIANLKHFYPTLFRLIATDESDFVHLLLDKQPSDTRDRNLYNYLAVAASHNSVQVMELLIGMLETRGGSEIDLTDILINASFRGRTKAIQLLLERKVTMNQPGQGFVDDLSGFVEAVLVTRNENISYEGVDDKPQSGYISQCSLPLESAKNPLLASLKGWRCLQDSLLGTEGQGNSYTKYQASKGNLEAYETSIRILLGQQPFTDTPAFGKELLESATVLASPSFLEHIISLVTNVDGDFNGKSILQIAASRELDAGPVFSALLKAGARLDHFHRSTELDISAKQLNLNEIIVSENRDESSSKHPASDTTHPILDTALNFFRCEENDCPQGAFSFSESVEQVLSNGPGAIVRMLLETLPLQRATDPRFGLVLRFAVAADDYEFVSLLVDRGVDVNATASWNDHAISIAAQNNSVVMLRMLSDAGADINVTEQNGDTPIMKAIYKGHTPAVRFLVDQGANIIFCSAEPSEEQGSLDDPDNHGVCTTTDFSSALSSTSPEIATLIMNAKVSQVKKLRQCPQGMIAACQHGRIDIVRQLIQMDVPVDKRGPTGLTPLTTACGHGHHEVVKLLLDRYVLLDQRILTEMQDSFIVGNGGQVDALDALLATIGHKTVATGEDNTFVTCADHLLDYVASTLTPENRHGVILKVFQAPKIDLEVAEALLDSLLVRDISNRASHNEITRLAISTRNKGLCKLLSEYALDNEEALELACAAGSADLVSQLLKCNVDLRRGCTDGNCLLSAAADGRALHVVKCLFETGSFESDQHKTCSSPIIVMLEGCRSLLIQQDEEATNAEKIQAGRVSSECEAMMKLFLAHGYSANAGNHNFDSALHVSSDLGMKNCVRLLLDTGALIDSEDASKMTPLHRAIEHANWDTATYLVERGAQVDLSFPDGVFPLHRACSESSPDLVKTLLEHGADLNAVDSQGMSPLACAIADGAEKAYYFRCQSANQKVPQSCHQILLSQPSVRVTQDDLSTALKVPEYYLEDDDLTKLLSLCPELAIDGGHIAILLDKDRLSQPSDAIKLILQRSDFEIDSDIILRIKDVATLRTLIEYQPLCRLQLDTVIELLDTTTEYNSEPIAVTRELLSLSQDFAVTEVLLKAIISAARPRSPQAIQNAEALLSDVLTNNPGLQITNDVLELAAHSELTVPCLRHTRQDRVPAKILHIVTNDLKEDTDRYSDHLMSMYQYDPSITLDHETIAMVVVRASECEKLEESLEAILDRQIDLEITVEVLDALVEKFTSNGWGDWVRAAAGVFDKHGKRVVFDDDFRERVKERLSEYPDEQILIMGLEKK